MSGNFTKVSLDFEFFKRVNTDLTPFETILYFFEDSDKMLVEIPNKSKCYITNRIAMQKYIKVESIETEWTRLIDGSYIKIKNYEIHQVLPIRTKLELVNYSFAFNMLNDHLHMIRKINEKHFKIRKKYSELRSKTGRLLISVRLPSWPIWVRIRTPLPSIKNKHSKLSKIYINVDDEFYRFPYGNVNSNDTICLGNNLKTFADIDEIWINLITTTFNMDYIFNLKTNSKLDVNRRRFHTENSIPTFNLDDISIRLSAKRYQQINLIDTLYYLSHIEDFDEFDPKTLLYKLPQLPWEEEIL